MKHLLIILLFILTFSKINCQFQYPPSLKWNQIETQHFNIIFTQKNDSAAQCAANLLESSYKVVSKPLEVNPKKISLLLKSESTISNGYVTLGPRYMAWYLTPFQDASVSLDGSDWFQDLSTHEFRHVVQFEKLDDGFTDFAGIILGDLGKTIFMNISAPLWFFEGDAIQSETHNSYCGRGRTPSFLKYNISLEEENIRYSYNKMYFGSYKNFTTNHYHLGYLLTEYINNKYGNDIWPTLLEKVSSTSFSPFSFSGNLKELTGDNLKKTYNNMRDYFDSTWSCELSAIQNYNDNFITVPVDGSKVWTSYTFPQAMDNGNVIALKYGLSDISTLIYLNGDSEKKLTEIAPGERIQSNGEKLVWCESFPDIRWGERNYSDVVIYNPVKNSKIRLTEKQKYFAPALSSDDKKIAVIEFSDHDQCSLVILDAETGKKLNSYHFNEREFARMPSWSENGEQIVLSVTKGQYKSICVFDSYSLKRRNITKPHIDNKTNPVFFKNYILFNSPLAGLDEIHAIDTVTGKRYKVINSKYGVYNPSIDYKRDNLFFEDYTVKGYRVKSIKIDTQTWQEINDDELLKNNYLYKLSPVTCKEDCFIDPEPDSSFKIKPYSPLLNSIYIHSWIPTLGHKSVGVNVFSNDILNTTSIIAGLDYFPKEFAHREYLNLSYAGLFPILSTEFSIGQKYESVADTNSDEGLRRMNEKVASGTISIPFDLSRGIYTTNLNLWGKYLYSWQQYSDTSFYLYGQKSLLSAVNAGISLITYKRMAARDLYPGLGGEFNLNVTKTVGNNTVSGGRYTIRGKIYLPGLFKHHSLQGSAGYERNDENYINSVYLLNTELDRVRGYSSYRYYDNAVKATLEYAFPVLYPDLNLGAFMYMKRIHGALFYDRGYFTSQGNSVTLESVGFDLNFEVFLLRFPAPIELGVRYARKLYDNTNSFEFLIFRTAL